MNKMIESSRVYIELLAQKRSNDIHIILKVHAWKAFIHRWMYAYKWLLVSFQITLLILCCNVWDFFLIPIMKTLAIAS